MDKTIYDLALHEKLWINSDLEVIRVPGGFMYTRIGYQSITSCFVPYEPIAHTGPR